MTAVSTSDKVKFLFIKNTSTADGIVICLDGGTAANDLADGIFIGPSQSWFGRLPNVTVANIHAISSDVADAGDATANAIVAVKLFVASSAILSPNHLILVLHLSM